jgi:type VI secretion system secreted protein VgrG
MSAHDAVAGYENVPFFPPTETQRRQRDHISQWRTTSEVRPGSYTHTDYDFTQPTLDLRTSVSRPRAHAHADGEIYDYPGVYLSTDLGGSLAGIRAQELDWHYRTAQGAGDVRGLSAGSLFTLTGHPREEQNREYLVVWTICDANGDGYGITANGQDTSAFFCSFAALSSAEQFRPQRTTPKPFVRGPQTALVVGSAGEEIDTDDYGRILVQFPWDRKGQKDANSSCRVRVGQLWASSGWGAMFIPRIGMEVIVDFIEGDPDRPIVTGCLYNGKNKSPYSLPAEKTKTTIKSNSTKGGGGSNEIRFEDKKGSEEIYIHAQKDRNLVIGNNETKRIANDQIIQVGNSRTETVDQGDESITISKGDRSVTVKEGDDTLTVSLGNQSTKVSTGSATTEAMQSIELKVGSSSVKIDPTGVSIKGMTITINGDLQTEVQGGAMVQVKGALVQINS